MGKVSTRKKLAGVTLIELMVVIAIVAILAAVAYAGYSAQVRKSRRSDAVVALTRVLQAEEKLRASCRVYGETLGGGATVCDPDDPSASAIEASANSENGHYTITVSGADGNGYTATATPVGVQAGDSVGGTACTMVLTVDTDNPDGLRTPAVCWP